MYPIPARRTTYYSSKLSRGSSGVWMSTTVLKPALVSCSKCYSSGCPAVTKSSIGKDAFYIPSAIPDMSFIYRSCSCATVNATEARRVSTCALAIAPSTSSSAAPPYALTARHASLVRVPSSPYD